MRGIAVHGSVLRKWRRDHGVTQEQLAEKIPCDIKTVRNAEKNRRLDASTVRRIADAMGVSLAAVVVKKDDPQRIAERNAQLVHDWQAVYNARDVDSVLAFYHDDATLLVAGAEDLPAGGEFRGKNAVREHFQDAFATFRTEVITPDRYKLDAVGDYVFLRVTASADVLATGQSFTAMVVHELEIKDGKIYRHTMVCDTAAIRACMPRSSLADEPAVNICATSR
jgi:ketosteroid isomerase-like protein